MNKNNMLIIAIIMCLFLSSCGNKNDKYVGKYDCGIELSKENNEFYFMENQDRAKATIRDNGDLYVSVMGSDMKLGNFNDQNTFHYKYQSLKSVNKICKKIKK